MALLVKVDGIGEIEIAEGSHAAFELDTNENAYIEWEDLEGLPQVSTLATEIASKAQQLRDELKDHILNVLSDLPGHGETSWKINEDMTH